MAGLPREELERLYIALNSQHQDHIRRKEAFDALTDRFNQSEVSLEEERAKTLNLERDNKRLSTELVRYIELASNAGTKAKGHDRNLQALTDTLQQERERASAAASALKVLDEDLHKTAQLLEAEKKNCEELQRRCNALQCELGSSRASMVESEQRALELCKLKEELRQLQEQMSTAQGLQSVSGSTRVFRADMCRLYMSTRTLPFSCQLLLTAGTILAGVLALEVGARGGERGMPQPHAASRAERSNHFEHERSAPARPRVRLGPSPGARR